MNLKSSFSPSQPLVGQARFADRFLSRTVPGKPIPRLVIHLFCLALGGILGLWGEGSLSAATVPPGFAETVIAGPSSGNWNQAVGMTFESNGRMYVWERGGRVWIKDPADPAFSLLIDITDEVGSWGDHGLLGFAIDPNFRQNGFIYLLYVVDRHHLLYFGTPNYNPNSNDYNSATIGRLTRYTCRSSNAFRSVDGASRFVLIGETKQTGIPICSDTHGVGSLVFGTDNTLLISTGDGASAYSTDTGGPAFNSFAPQALADGIIRPKEDIGSYRSQLVDCLGGKALRIDPLTGNGLPSNPFFDPANPRAPRSRVWALGLRNPFRMTARPGTGSHNAADGDPGVLYVGIVGYQTWESLDVVTAPGQNFGWPVWEGLEIEPSYSGQDVFNLDAPNPLYPASGCNHYFTFQDLLKEDTLDPAGRPPFVNPCNSAQRIPASIPQFLHTRAALEWNHFTAITKAPIYGSSGQAQKADIGAANSPVSGSPFAGNCSVGGAWYTATAFPTQYQNTYFHADWGGDWIKNMAFDQNDKLLSVTDFLSDGGRVTIVVQHPTDGSLYYVAYDYGDPGTIRQIAYVGNRTPVAVASPDQVYGPGPLTVQFSSAGSTDPDGQSITYSWNFGDGSPVSTQANPSHTFSAPAGVPTKFAVTLTVTDSGGLAAQAKLIVSLNNTPPNVSITSPVDASLYSPTSPTTINLTATVTDAESSNTQLHYEWQTLLHHNDHNHSHADDTNHVTTTVLSPTGCDGINIFYYRIILTVTDPAGLATTREVRVFPNCGPNTPPTISDIPNRSTFQDRPIGPISFTIGDHETAVDNLQLSAVSSNPVLVPNANIVFGGSGSNRTVTVTPGVGQTGTATLVVSVTDGPLTASDTFVVTVNSPPPGTLAATNASTITIPTVGTAAPYPSSISLGGMGGTISGVTLTVKNLSHTWTPDLDILLAAPGGQGVVLMSDAGAGGASGVTLTFSDSASGALPQTPLTSGTYKPANYPPADSFPAPAPAGPYGSTLSSFNGLSANGNWGLYVLDDGNGDQGQIAGGWSLTVTTTKPSGAPPTIANISDKSTAANTPTAPIPFTVADSDSSLTSLTLTGSSSNPTLVPNANFAFGGSGGSRSVTITPAAGQVGVATITLTVSDGSSTASAGFVLTVTGVNTPPTISDIADQVTTEDTTLGPLAFTVGDAETAAGTLTLSATSSNPGLVPNANILFGGSGANRTVTIIPATDQNGTATLTLTVSDGSLAASNTFLVTFDPVNDPPTISSIANQSVAQDTVAGPIAFTIGDAETASASLSVTANSSNQTLVADANIVLGGSGANRTVTITPASGLTGTATVSLTVSDGAATTVASFVLTVTPVNTPPTISGLSDQIINEDTATDALPFTVGDSFTPVASLTLSAVSSNPALAPVSNIVFGGSGANRTVTVTPATNQNGTATIAVIVSDGSLTATNAFVLTVNAVNDPPTISSVADRTISVGTSTGPVSFTVGDVETAAASLTVQATSSNQLLVPDANVVPGGSGANRTVTVTPASGQSGTATITLKVSDGSLDTSTSFVLTVSTLITASFTNVGTIAIPDSGAATPYPSSITVSNMAGTVTDLTLTLNNLTHTWTRDIDVLLVGPAGQTVIVMSDAGYGGVDDVTLTFSDAADSALPPTQLTSGTFTPADYTDASSGGDNYPDPAPAGPYGTTLSAFDGQTVNGIWSLYVFDDGPGDQGAFAGGWILTVTSEGSAGSPPAISNIPDQSTTTDTATPAISFVITDVDSPISNLVLSGSSSSQALVPDANIVFGGSGTNRTVTITPANGQTGTATITITVSDESSSATDTFLLSVNAANTPPTISGLVDQTTNEDSPIGPLAFTIGDAETAPASLTVSGTSSDPELIPNANILFGGSGLNRTTTITPAPDQSGTATISVVVSDGSLMATNTFVLTVNAVDDPPTLSAIADRTVNPGVSTGPITFTVADVDTPLASLSLQGSSGNQTLVPDSNIVFGGSGASRTVAVSPVADQTGTAAINVVVSDGQSSATQSFVLTVSAVIGTARFTNSDAITIPDIGPAAPYPSVINVSTMEGIITNVSISLNRISHTWPDDIDMVLVGPTGRKVVVLSDVGGANPVTNVTVSLSDDAALFLPDDGPIVAGAFKPTNIRATDNFPNPVPVGPVFAKFSAFNGLTANGPWSLYVADDGPGDRGAVGGGWILEITTTSSASTIPDAPDDSTNVIRPTLFIVNRDALGQVVLRIEGLPWEKYVIEGSDDLIAWTPLGVAADVTGVSLFTDVNAVTPDRRFYRVSNNP